MGIETSVRSEMENRFKNHKEYFYWGLTAFCVIAASIILYYILQKLPVIGEFIGKVISILQPFIYGLLIAYLLTPLMTKLNKKLPKWASVIICELVVLLILALLVYLILPQLYQSIETLIKNGPKYLEDLKRLLQKFIPGSDNEQAAEEYLGEVYNSFSDIIGTRLLPSLNSLVSNLTLGVSAVFKSLYNLLIGIIVSAYVIANKDNFVAGARKILYSVFTIPVAEKIRSALSFANKVFMNFFAGKVLDSAIIGVICYVFCLIAKIPFALLVSVIVGITNIIPFFGPFIGAVPTSIIILLVDPVKCLIFVIFIIILQQIDGNFIGPKILGSTTGISGFWIMFAIILGGGLFGFWGMLFGVPVFVCIYAAVASSLSKKLIRSGLPTDKDSYIHLDYIDAGSCKPVKKQNVKQEKKSEKKENTEKPPES